MVDVRLHAMILLALLGCDDTATMAVGGDLKAIPSTDVVTVGSFSFLPNDVERTRVEVSDEEGPLLASDWSDPGSTRLTARLIGLPAASTLTARLVTEGGEELDDVEFETGAFSPDVPVLSLTGEPGWAGYMFTSVIGTGNVALVLDERGQVIWYHISDDVVVLSRTRLRPDLEGITFIMAPGGAGAPQYLANVDWASTAETRFAEDQHVTHDFVYRPDGGITSLVTTVAEINGENKRSGALVELQSDGTAQTLWVGEDTWPEGVVQDRTLQGPHINSLTYDAERDRYWWTVENADALLSYDRTAGTWEQILGREGAEYTYVGDPGLFRPHHIWLTGDSVRIHDNRDVVSNSRIVEYQFDSAAKTATFTGEWFHDPPVYDFALGDVHTRSDQSMLVTWCSSGLIDDFGPDGTVRASVAGPLGAAFGYTEVHDGLPGQVRLR